MSKLKDCKVYVIECRVMTENHTWGAWESPFPDMRYSHADVVEFEDDLDYDDCHGIQWRARMCAPWGTDVIHMEPHRHYPVRFSHRTIPLAPGECLPPTGWAGVIHQLNQGA